jgi:hypothetical protein
MKKREVDHGRMPIEQTAQRTPIDLIDGLGSYLRSSIEALLAPVPI